jgi:hypothetical protein
MSTIAPTVMTLAAVTEAMSHGARCGGLDPCDTFIDDTAPVVEAS